MQRKGEERSSRDLGEMRCRSRAPWNWIPAKPSLQTACVASVRPRTADSKSFLKKSTKILVAIQSCQISLLISLYYLNGNYTNICSFVQNLQLFFSRETPKVILYCSSRVFVLCLPSVAQGPFPPVASGWGLCFRGVRVWKLLARSFLCFCSLLLSLCHTQYLTHWRRRNDCSVAFSI